MFRDCLLGTVHGLLATFRRRRKQVVRNAVNDGKMKASESGSSEILWPSGMDTGKILNYETRERREKGLLDGKNNWAEGPTDRSLWQRHRNRWHERTSRAESPFDNMGRTFSPQKIRHLFLGRCPRLPWSAPLALISDGIPLGFLAVFSRIPSKNNLDRRCTNGITY